MIEDRISSVSSYNNNNNSILYVVCTGSSIGYYHYYNEIHRESVIGVCVTEISVYVSIIVF